MCVKWAHFDACQTPGIFRRRPQPRRTVVLSFDNLGEASELERGTRAAPAAPNGHPSVTVALPRLLDELNRQGLRATFFVEAINCELHPEAVRQIADRGHELGVHGWRHEEWGGLPADRERRLLSRAREAFAALGLEPRAFRPPGGELTEHTPRLLHELGFEWCSPAAGEERGGEPSLRYLPFEWELVDAYHLMERFGPLRARRGDPRAPRQAQETFERLRAGLRMPAGASRTLILHPFLMLDEPWWEQVRRLLAELAADRSAWVGPGGEVPRISAPCPSRSSS